MVINPEESCLSNCGSITRYFDGMENVDYDNEEMQSGWLTLIVELRASARKQRRDPV